MDIQSTVSLNNGNKMPLLGLGVYQTSSGRETINAVRFAFNAGYRHIDTAKIYGNEKDVGSAITRSGIPREEIFITTKLWNSDHGYKATLDACRESLKRLGIDFIDLYLIHWPVSGLRGETWKAMEELLQEGKCKAIGVSNYTISHLKELLDNSKVIPAVNQVEFHPYLYQKELLEFCRTERIQVEAYSPLVRGKKMKDARLLTIAKKYGKSPAQILIRWAIQHDLVVIPKSAREDRIRENADVFDFSISQEDFESLNGFHENLRTCWDPEAVK